MIRKSVWAMLLLGWASMAQGQPHGTIQHAQYRVRWSDADFPVARVEARLVSRDCTFGTAEKWASFFDGKDGWSQFVRGLSARDGRGRPMRVRALGGGRWAVGEARRPCLAQLAYAVDFSFGRKAWEAGNEQVAYLTDSAVYSTGLPLYVIGDDGPAEIKVEVPRGWNFATPWTRIGANAFRAADHRSLLENVFVAGRTYSESFAAGQFDVTVALLGLPDTSAEQVRRTFHAVAPRLVDQFGDDSAGRYMIAVMRGPEDGESFEDSFAVATENPLTADNRIVWANHLAHELIHYWIGKAIHPPSGEEANFKWFTEGFTEYLANQTLLDAGIYSPVEFNERMARHFGNYLMTRQNPFFMETNLRAAGQKGWANRPLIYSGGATLAFCLDTRIRKSSGGRKSLFTPLRALHAAGRSGAALTDAAIVEAMSSAAGEDLSGFFATYVAGTRTLPVAECAADAGMRANIQGYDVFLGNASGR